MLTVTLDVLLIFLNTMSPNLKYLLSAIVLLLSMPLAAHNTFLDLQHWQLQADLSIQDGKVYERVFDGAHQLSELEWDIQEIPIGILTASYAYSPSVTWHFALWSRLLNEGKGQIIDRDWENYSSTTPTHLSIHEAPITRAHGYTLSVDAILSHIPDYDIGIETFPYSLHMKAAQLHGIVGYKTSLYRWVAHGGFLNYPIGTFSIPSNVSLLWYEQRLRAPFAGLAYSCALNDGLLTLQATATTFATADDLDKHYARNLIFEGEFHLAEWYTLEANYLYPLTNNLKVHIGYALDWMPTRRGNSLIRDIDFTEEVANSAGIAHKTHHYTLGLHQQF